jgi:hypothetical protein
MRQGSAWTQPPRIKHKINDYSEDAELLEIILPAEFETVELAGLGGTTCTSPKRGCLTLTSHVIPGRV